MKMAPSSTHPALSLSSSGVLIPPDGKGDFQGDLGDWELERFGGIAASTKDWGTCPGTPTAGRDCCVGGTVG